MDQTKRTHPGLITFVRIGAIAAIVIIVLFLIFRTKPIPNGESYTASDIVYTNIQQPQMTKSGGAVFFTGSSEAKIEISDSPRQLSTSLVQDVPFENPGKAIYDDVTKSLITSVEYTGQSEAFQLSGKRPGIYWVITRKNKNPKVINPSSNQTVDAVASDGVLYGLTVGDDSSFNLYTYNLTSDVTTVIAKNIASNSLVGATASSVVTRKQDGTLVIYSDMGEELRSIKVAGSVIHDQTSDILVNTNDDISRKRYKITTYDARSGRKLSSTKTPYRYIYVSSGMIYASQSKVRPADLVSYNQRTLKPERHSLELLDTRSKDAILSIVTLKKSPLTLGVVGSSNSMYILSTNSRYASSFPQYQYPYFKSSLVGETTVQSLDGSTDVILKTNLSNIPQSLIDLETSCACDANQLSKTWLSNAVTIEDGE